MGMVIMVVGDLEEVGVEVGLLVFCEVGVVGGYDVVEFGGWIG